MKVELKVKMWIVHSVLKYLHPTAHTEKSIACSSMNNLDTSSLARGPFRSSQGEDLAV